MSKKVSDLDRIGEFPGIQRVATDFMVTGKDLLRRLRTTEAHMLTGAEIRMLRIQLHLLDIEIYNLPFHQAPRS